jgi:hypothetical protein
LWINLGPDIMAGCLGCDLEFGENTSWSAPNILDWEHIPDLSLRDDNRWWRLLRELTQAAVAASGGRYAVGMTDIHADGDLVAALRGPQTLCLDLALYPDEVQRVEALTAPAFYQMYNELYRLTHDTLDGSITWFNVWYPGRWYPLSCDFSFLISPKMFQKFFLPEIERQARWLDTCLYHLDGPRAVVHLDALLEVKEIRGIQWVPGAGTPSMLPWLPMLKKYRLPDACCI